MQTICSWTTLLGCCPLVGYPGSRGVGRLKLCLPAGGAAPQTASAARYGIWGKTAGAAEFPQSRSSFPPVLRDAGQPWPQELSPDHRYADARLSPAVGGNLPIQVD